MPRFRFQNESNLFGDQTLRLGDKIAQVHLPGNYRQQLESDLKTLVDVCDLLSLAETARDFLLVTGGNAGDGLLARMKQLRLGLGPKDNRGGTIPRTLKALELQHLDALIAHLSLVRAKRMVLNKQNPFNLVKGQLQESLPKELNRCLDDLTRKIRTDVLLAKLHGFISEFLRPKGLATEDPEKELGSWMYAYLEEKEENEEAANFMATFDKELKNKHAVDIFKKLVHKQAYAM